MATKPASKIQIVMHPALPATCAVCNKSANGIVKFLDFQKDLDYYGAVLICEDCGREMLDALDFAPVAQVTYRDQQIAELQQELQVVREENERVRAALDSVLVVRPDLRSNGDRVDGVDSSES